MSRGSFCRSPSEVTISRPRACAKPAENAAVWPKLRRKRMTRRCGSRACSRARIAKALVRAPVVDDDDFVGAAPRRERLGQLAMQLLEARRLVANRDDDAQVDHVGRRAIVYRRFPLRRACLPAG